MEQLPSELIQHIASFLIHQSDWFNLLQVSKWFLSLLRSSWYRKIETSLSIQLARNRFYFYKNCGTRMEIALSRVWFETIQSSSSTILVLEVLVRPLKIGHVVGSHFTTNSWKTIIKRAGAYYRQDIEHKCEVWLITFETNKLQLSSNDNYVAVYVRNAFTNDKVWDNNGSMNYAIQPSSIEQFQWKVRFFSYPFEHYIQGEFDIPSKLKECATEEAHSGLYYRSRLSELVAFVLFYFFLRPHLYR